MDAPKQVDLTGDVPGATQEDLFGHDARPRPAGKPRPAKKTKSDATTSTGGSSASTQFGELMEQELRLKQKAAERAFEVQAKKDRTLMWLEELRFLATSNKDLDNADAYWIKKQKRLIRNKMRNDLGDEDEDDSSNDEDELTSELAVFTKVCQAVYEASKPKVLRNPVERDRYGAHDRLVGISSLMKCTFAIRQMAYGAVPDSLDEYLQMGATTARDSLRNFCKVIMNLYGEEFLRKPTYTDMEKPYAHHDEKHWFPEMLRSIDYLKSGKAPDVPFMANNVPYKRGYYLIDGIYPQWGVLIKSIKNPGTNDHKRILYKTKHEAARKEVERAFGVLKTKWKLIKYPARGMSRRRLSDVMYTCIILHNIHENGEAISPDFFQRNNAVMVIP
nr:hypothetical protein [Tanacetum cinerariifolium]